MLNRLLTLFGCLRNRHFTRNGAKMTHGKQQTRAERPFNKNFLMSGLLATVLFTQPIESGADKKQRCFLLILTITAFPFHGRRITLRDMFLDKNMSHTRTPPTHPRLLAFRGLLLLRQAGRGCLVRLEDAWAPASSLRCSSQKRW